MVRLDQENKYTNHHFELVQSILRIDCEMSEYNEDVEPTGTVP